MIERYTRPEMGVLWSHEHRFGKMLEVEIAVAEAQAELKIIPSSAVKNIKAKAKFSVKRIAEIEKVTRHDVIAFVSNLAENVGDSGKYIHYGMTSSDVLDTAFSLQIREAGNLVSKGLTSLEKTLGKLVRKHKETLCAGRTHGMFAEPTTFGFKMAGFLAETKRNHVRLLIALENSKICKLSGAVGTYSAQPIEVEKRVARKLKLRCETIATQVIPRDRHAEVLSSLAFIGAGLERLAVELRHLQRSDVAEVTEGFAKGQKGSSAMPHKKNPISAENITGGARLLRGYMSTSFENIALWHERDISHSSVERVIFPDAFILADYLIHRMVILLEGLEVNKEQMIENINRSLGQLYSSHVLLALVDKGMKREDAYRHVQRLCHSLGRNENLKEKILADSEIGTVLDKRTLEEIFSGRRHKKSIGKVLQRAISENSWT